MATDPRNNAHVMSQAECWGQLGGEQLGRLAVAVGGQPDIFPVNYVVVDETIVIRTGEGSKLASVAINGAVAFEIDGLDESTNTAWSVVVHGAGQIIEHSDIVAYVESLPWFPWNTAPKNRFIQIIPRGVSGRSFIAEGRTAPE